MNNTKESVIKVLIKVLDENKDVLVWEHLCYAPKNLYLKFLCVKDIERSEVADYVSQWCKEDFNMELPMTTAKDIKILRELVIDRYRVMFPYLSRPSKIGIDQQGWMRVWLSRHIEKELQRK